MVEEGESVLEAAQREIDEEVGATIHRDDLEPLYLLPVRKSEVNSRDIVGVYFGATQWVGTPHNNEPSKIFKAQWFNMNDIPNKYD